MQFKKLHTVIGACCLLFSATNIQAQTQPDSIKYEHKDLFSPISWPITGSEVRSASGQPGPKYWQNRADYNIHVTLNELAKDTTVSGQVSINYTNNSPDNMDYLWLQLDQNLFKPGSRGAAVTPITGDRFDVKGFSRGGIH